MIFIVVFKVRKVIDRNCISSWFASIQEDVFSGVKKTRFLNQVICQHFDRQGILDIAGELVAETGIKTDEGRKPIYRIE